MNFSFAKAAMLMLVVVSLFLLFWELTWRGKGFGAYYDDNAALWAHKRAQVYQSQDRSTVFIGSSRIKFDLDVPTWQELTGESAVQLAIVGSSPFHLLQDLAGDPNFKGKLVVDITEPLYFSSAPPYAAKPNEFVGYFKKATPSEKFSFEVSRRLESQFVFLNKEYLSLNGLLNQVNFPRRENVFLFPYFPHQFEVTEFSRQSRMLDEFVRDTSLQQMQQRNWLTLFEAAKHFPPPPPGAIDQIFADTKSAVEQIKSRGGKVIFVRTPSSSPMWEGEQQGFPRDKYWDRLLSESNAPGIHFADYTETSKFRCPEWSHLSPADAVVYTTHLVRQIQEQGWNVYHPKQAHESVASKK
jgi:hypothetical protein